MVESSLIVATLKRPSTDLESRMLVGTQKKLRIKVKKKKKIRTLHICVSVKWMVYPSSYCITECRRCASLVLKAFNMKISSSVISFINWSYEVCCCWTHRDYYEETLEDCLLSLLSFFYHYDVLYIKRGEVRESRLLQSSALSQCCQMCSLATSLVIPC